jgi:hypothetical protein
MLWVSAAPSARPAALDANVPRPQRGRARQCPFLRHFRGDGWSVARATKIIAALLIGLFLSVPHAALAQEPNEAATLTQQIIQLYKQGRYSEAIPLAQRLLTISEPLGPDHPDVANSCVKAYQQLAGARR